MPNTIQILFNGKSCELPTDADLLALIENQQLQGKRFAVEINMNIVPRSQFADHQLHDGDRVEIVHAIGGG